jgi:hypothetical protein
MKFFMILHPDPNSTAANGPSEQFMAAMGEYIAPQMASGKVIATGAMEPIQQATIVEPVAGKATVVDGPFTEAKELVGGWVIVEAESRDEAVAGAREFIQLHVDQWPGWNGYSEVHEVYE